MTDPNVNPNGQEPWQQPENPADSNPTEALPSVEQPTQPIQPTPQYQNSAAPSPAPGGTIPPQTPYNPYVQPAQPPYGQGGGQPYAQPAQSPYAQPGQPGAQPAQSPYTQPGQPTQPPYAPPYNQCNYIPPEANQKYNSLAIAGFVCSFLVSIVGLILSIIGLNQIKKQGGKGRGLAIAGIIISAASILLGIIMAIALIVGGASYVNDMVDHQNSDYSYSQSDDLTTSDPNATPQDQNNLDNLDDVLDDTLGETGDDIADGDFGVYGSVQSLIDSSEFKQSIASEADLLASTGVTFNYRAEGDTLVYDYTLSDDYAAMGDILSSSLGAMGDVYQSTANSLGTICKPASGKVSLRVMLHTAGGQTLFDQTWTQQ